MQLEQFANPKGHGVPEALFCRGTSPVRSSVRQSLVFRIPDVGKPHGPKISSGSISDMRRSWLERPLRYEMQKSVQAAAALCARLGQPLGAAWQQ